MSVDEGVRALARAAPGFAPVVERFVAEWSDDAESPPWYVLMGELAHYVVESYEQRRTQEFPALFVAVERLLEQADPEVANLMSVGFLEDIQSIATHRSFADAVFKEWLGPKGLVAWDQVAARTEEVQRWLNRTYRQRWWQFWRPAYPGVTFTAEQLDRIDNSELRRTAQCMFRRVK